MMTTGTTGTTTAARLHCSYRLPLNVPIITIHLSSIKSDKLCVWAAFSHDGNIKVLTPSKQQILKTLIVDDESLARRGLALRLRNIADIEIIGEARNGREALKLIEEKKPDLVFLDIQMPGVSGFEVVQQLDIKTMPVILFLTAYDEYAVRAFEVNALDYILKPIDEERLHHVLDKVRTSISQKRALKQKRLLLKLVSDISGETISSFKELEDKDVAGLVPKEPSRLAIRDGGRTTWVIQDDIEWIDAAGDYMCVQALGVTYIMRKTMKELERELDENILQRIHRSTIVNFRQVREMEPHINGEYFLTLKSGHRVKLSRTYKHKLKLFK
jgi:two-component system LytT family response regulator